MTECVVYRFEIIEIDKENRQPLLVAGGFGDGMLQNFAQCGAVGQAGQRIVRRHILNNGECTGQLLVGTKNARAHCTDSRANPRKRGQQQCQPCPLIPLDKHIDPLWLEVHQQIDDQRVAGQHEQGGGGKIARLETKHAKQHHHKAPGQRQTPIMFKVIGDDHDYGNRCQRLREHQAGIGGALV